jgi:GH25 family lysozyme M1 (1,4-beta-N-acetylmuramidase)
VAHPDDDYMGSTVAAHEPTQLLPQVLAPNAVAGTQGLDVSNHQGTVNWGSVAAAGAKFVYMKATEGTTFVDGQFNANYTGSTNAGLYRGAYHFALPDVSSGAIQANFFIDHGGGWTPDGITLPPVIDIEYNPYGSTCYGLSPAAMSAWLADFANTVHARTNRWPVIYSTTDWWSTCTGNDPGFAGNSPLWIARYSTSAGVLPAGWPFYTFWQYNDVGAFPGDQDVFNGAIDQLGRFATGDGGGDDPIVQHYQQVGGPTSYLGDPVGGEVAVGQGTEQDYRNGLIDYSANTGAWAVHGAIVDHFRELSGAAGALGFPTTDESGTPDGVGRFNHFDNADGSGDASIYWTPSTGAWSVHGAIHAKWAALGWETFLGYPTTDETGTPDGVGRFNHFNGADGASIYWSPSTGAWSVHGAIRAKWAQLGWERSTLGYPTSDEFAIPGGRRSNFEHGAIEWNASNGSTTVINN